MRSFNLTDLQQARLNDYLLADRQWKRPQRLGYARLMLKFAWAAEETKAGNLSEVNFYRAVIAANTLSDEQQREARANEH